MSEENKLKDNFITQIIDEDLKEGTVNQVVTRFPPEPNGYLHIGHAKSIFVNFSMKERYKGICNLRFDDTNPLKEDIEYIDSIKEDVKWLGYEWDGEVKYASNYFDTLYEYALVLIQKGLAYVDSLSAEEIRSYRGTLQAPGKNSPYRNRSIDENLKLFSAMKEGQFQEGELVLRAKIDMSSPNINLRDPVIYRIRHATHPKAGDKWCVYPMYDFAHTLSDAIEGITHSICTLEFQDHRPLYEWLIEHVKPESQPHQYEFARLNVSHTITSKRKLKSLIDEGYVTGWSDPRMPTIKGMRERGYPSQALKRFCAQTGVSKSDSVIDMSLLEECVRDELNQSAPRAMCVLHPLKVVITNYPEDKTEEITTKAHPNDESLGRRTLPFSREIWIEQDDFMAEPPKGYFRLSPGKEVRLRNAYVIKCVDAIYDDSGNVIELHCEYDDKTLGKKPEGRKVKGVIHWVAKNTAKACEVTLLDRLFLSESPGNCDNIVESINPNSTETLTGAYVEPGITSHELSQVFQFERQGYFRLNTNGDKLSFHRVVGLRDTWSKS